MLAKAATGRELRVSDFPAVFGEDGQLPRRTVQLASVDGEAVSPSSGATSDPVAGLAREIEQQGGRYAAERVEVVGDQLIVRYGVSAPADLLPEPVP